MANPAARTAADCKKAATIRVPTGNASIASVPMSNTKKQTQSVNLSEVSMTTIRARWGTHVKASMTNASTQVWVEGNKYMKHL
jgi:hypothetical protein